MNYLGVVLIVIGAILLLLTVLAPTFGVPLWVGIVALVAGVLLAFLVPRS